MACVTTFLNVCAFPLSSNFRTLRNALYKSSFCVSRILQSNLEVKIITKIRKDEKQSGGYETKNDYAAMENPIKENRLLL